MWERKMSKRHDGVTRFLEVDEWLESCISKLILKSFFGTLNELLVPVVLYMRLFQD
jgi:hypothetical protein